MDKIKNFLSSSKVEDKNQSQPPPSTTHGSGLTGEGSHLQSVASTETTPSTMPGSAASHSTLAGQSTARSGEGSHLAGATSGHTQTRTPASNVGLADRSTSNTSSGLPARSEYSGVSAGTATGTGLVTDETTTTTNGPHSSALANRADPRVDSDNSRGPSSGLGNQTSGITSGPAPNTVSSGLTQHSGVAAGASTGANISTTHPSDSTTQSKSLGNAQIGGPGPSIGKRALASVTDTPSSHTQAGSGPSDLSGTSTSRNAHVQTHMPGEWADEGSTGVGLSGAGAGLGLGSKSGYGTHVSNAYPQQTSPTSGNHLGRDAAVVGAAGAVGSGIHSHGYDGASRLNEGSSGHAHNTQSSNPQASNGTTQGNSTTIDPGSSIATSGPTHNTQSSIMAHEKTHDSNTTSGSNLGRDAVIAGAAGAVGAGAHHHHENKPVVGSNTGSTGASHGTSHLIGPHGPHTTNTANLLDPSVNTRGTGLEDALHHSPRHGGGAEEADTHHRASDFKTGSAAAVDATRRGGVGVGDASGPGRSVRTTGPAPHTAGPHAKDYQNILDPRVTPQNAAVQGTGPTGIHDTKGSSGNHYGRDSAVAGGAATAAFAAGHHGSSVSGVDDPSRVGQPGSSTAGVPRHTQHSPGAASTDQPGSTTQHLVFDSSTDQSRDHHFERDAVVAGGVGTAAHVVGNHSSSVSGVDDPSRVGQQGPSTVGGPQHAPGTATTHHSAADPTADRSKDHRYGRDAVVAGGVGGVAYEVNEHSNEKNIARAQKEAEKEHRHEVEAVEKQHKHAEKQAEKDLEHAEKHNEKEKKHGFLSFLHRDKSKKYSKEEEDDFDRQEREHNASQSHAGRTAALGGTAAGAGAGAAAYGQHEADTNKPLPTAPGNHGVGTGAGTQNALAGNASTHDGNVIGTGGYGAGKFVVHHDANTKTPLDQKPVGKDIGDHLHGDRNRGVQGASGFPGEPGYGDGTTGRDHGGLLHDHDHGKHSITQGNAPATGHGAGHVDRHAAVPGSTGVAGAGLAEHEHRTPGSNFAANHPRSGLAHGQPGQTGVSRTMDTGRVFPLSDAGQHGHARHDSGYPHDKTSPTYAASYPTASSDLEQEHMPSAGPHPKTSDLSGRNRLHKDPPAGHPAYSGAGAGDALIPASDSERRNLVGEGREELRRDTGAVNASGDGAVGY
ncbi:hypothetical protein JHW43_006019 [Diplocarpon mali]|nr:hypothetical protein JHW43_006019 [Diplocarpon mali]